MKLLIVDDEIDTVDYLAGFLEKNVRELDKIETAYSAKKAMELICMQRPDIVLCDIEMPQMSGLSLLEWISEMEYDCEFIILSCHERFDYAAKAIQHQVNCYLTKPIDEAAIVNTILTCIRKIESEKSRKLYSEYGQAWLKSQKMIYQSFWQNLLFNASFDNSATIQAELLNYELGISIGEPWHMVVTGFVRSEVEERVVNAQTFSQEFQNLAVEIITGDLQYLHVLKYLESHFLYYILLIPQSMAEIGEIKARCDDFALRCEESMRYHTNCWIGSAASLEGLVFVKNEIFNRYIGNRDNGQAVICLNEKARDPAPNIGDLRTAELAVCFERRDRLGVISLMKEVVGNLAQCSQLDKKALIIIHQSYIQVLYSYLQEHGIVAEQMFMDEMARQLYQKGEKTVFDMMKWIDFSADKAIKHVIMSEDEDMIVNKVKQYIKEHYHENIKRSTLANIVYLTPNYLSTLFGRKAGQSLTEYISKYRVSIAKKKLANRNALVSEIAMDCGFNNLSYFSTIFRKEVGVTPNEYRAQLSQERQSVQY